MNCNSADLGRWDLLKPLSRKDRLSLMAFSVFRNFNCTGAFLISRDDDVFGVSSDNCCDISLFGLGDDDKVIVSPMQPFRIEKLSGRRLASVSVGVTVGAALDFSGQLYWWGKTSSLLPQPTGCTEDQKTTARLPELAETDLDPAPEFKQVSCGHSLVAALTAAGKVFVWGRLICSIFECEELVVNAPVDSLSCGGVHVAMLTADGKVYTWGVGFDGQRGSFARADLLIVKPIDLPERCVSVVCGPVSTVMLLESGQIYVCGANNEDLGYLGVECPEPKVTKPVKLNLDEKITDVFVTWIPKKPYVVYAAVNENEDVFVWGSEPVPKKLSPECENGGSLINEAFLNLATPRNVGLVQIDRPDSSDPSEESSIEILSQSSASHASSPVRKLDLMPDGCQSTITGCSDINTMTEPICTLNLAYELFGSSKLSDITFVFVDSKFPGHRLYLCSRSKYFRETLDMNVPAETSPEMDCRAYDADAFKSFLEYLYRGAHSSEGMVPLLNLHGIAVKFHEPELAETTSDKIIDLLTLTPEAVCTVVTMARSIPSPALEKKCASYVTYMSAINPSTMTDLFMTLASKYS